MAGNSQKKLKLGVIFGGVSSEHEISIITAVQLMEAVDTEKYDIVPIYISTSGRWYTGEKLFHLTSYKRLSSTLSNAREIILLPLPERDPFIYADRSDNNEKNIRLRHREALKIDIVFLALHGTNGEDGAIQGLLVMAKVPFVGSGILASSITMNKWKTKVFAEHLGIPVLPSIIGKKMDFINNFEERFNALLSSNIKFPVIVKPCNLGSSVGLNFANSEQELKQAIVSVLKFDHEFIIEPRVTKLTEINVSVFGRTSPRASVIEVPVSKDGLLTYEKKYLSESGAKKGAKTSATGMANLSREIDPGRISMDLKEQARKYAIELFSSLDCGGIVRIDFIYDEEAQQLYFNELNSIPGSFSFYLWEDSTPRYLLTELVDYLVQETLDEFGIMQTIEQIQPFRAIKQ